MRKSIILLILACLIVLTSCSTPITEPTPTTTPTAAPTIVEKPEPSPTPEPLTVLESALTEDEKNMTPEVEGLYRTKEGEEYVYRALGDNEYGLGEGEYAGGFKEEVYMPNFYADDEGYLVYNEDDVRKSGGLVLLSSVVEKIVIKREELYPINLELAPIPIDISSIDAGDKIILSVDSDLSGPEKTREHKMGSLKLELPKSAPIINICHGVNTFSVIKDRDDFFIINDFIKDENWRSSIDSGNGVVPDKYVNIIYFSSNFLGVEDIGKTFINLEYGDQIMESGTVVYVASMHGNGAVLMSEQIITLDSDIGEVPLFIKANN